MPSHTKKVDWIVMQAIADWAEARAMNIEDGRYIGHSMRISRLMLHGGLAVVQQSSAW